MWVPKTSSKSCEQAMFVDLATDASVSSDAVLLKIDGFGQRFQRRGAVQGAVRPVLIVVSLILTQDPAQMVLVPDESAVQEFAAASSDPAFGDRIHAGRPHVAQHGPDLGAGEDRVERGGEVRSAPFDRPTTMTPPSAFAKVIRGGPRSFGAICALLRSNHWSSGRARRRGPTRRGIKI